MTAGSAGRRLFIPFVDKVEAEIDADKKEVDQIKRQHIIGVVVGDLTHDAEKITDQYCGGKNDAFALGGSGGQTFEDRDRPRNTKTDQHDAFKNRSHKFNSLVILSCGRFAGRPARDAFIIALTDPFV